MPAEKMSLAGTSGAAARTGWSGPREVNTRQKRGEIGIDDAARALQTTALGGAGDERIRVWRRGAVGIRKQARRVQCGIHDTKRIVLGQKRVLKIDPCLQVVHALHVGKLGMQTCVRQAAALADGVALQIRCQVRKRILAGVIVELILTEERADGKSGFRAD